MKHQQDRTAHQISTTRTCHIILAFESGRVHTAHLPNISNNASIICVELLSLMRNRHARQTLDIQIATVFEIICSFIPIAEQRRRSFDFLIAVSRFFSPRTHSTLLYRAASQYQSSGHLYVIQHLKPCSAALPASVICMHSNISCLAVINVVQF